MTYAEKTDVPIDRSLAEIERTLARYGASAFGYMTELGRATVMFEANERRVRFDLPLPRIDEERFQVTPERGLKRTEAQTYAAWEQACRQRWRALALAVKAKLEAVEAGIAEFEDEFLAYITLPTGQTMSEIARPAIAHAYDTGSMPALMPGAR